MSRYLFLDDNEFRHKFIDDNTSSDVEVIHCYDLDQFIAALREYDSFDVVSLDHDLNDFASRSILYDGSEATGLDACGYLVRKEFVTKLPKTIYVHSVNPCGAKNMSNFLKSRGFDVVLQPFPCA